MSEDAHRRSGTGGEQTDSWRTDAWRRGRDVLDGYDDDRVCSEQLADDLVNELAGRLPRPARRRAPVRGCPPDRTRHLTVVRG